MSDMGFLEYRCTSTCEDEVSFLSSIVRIRCLYRPPVHKIEQPPCKVLHQSNHYFRQKNYPYHLIGRWFGWGLTFFVTERLLSCDSIKLWDVVRYS